MDIDASHRSHFPHFTCTCVCFVLYSFITCVGSCIRHHGPGTDCFHHKGPSCRPPTFPPRHHLSHQQPLICSPRHNFVISRMFIDQPPHHEPMGTPLAAQHHSRGPAKLLPVSIVYPQLFLAESQSVMWLEHGLSNHSPVKGQLVGSSLGLLQIQLL